MFYPIEIDSGVLSPYTNVPVKIIAKYKGLDGHYRIEILAEEKPYKWFDEPYAEFIPEFKRTNGKPLR